MAAAKTIIFHIGLEKTATTSFQEFCRAHCDALERQGLLYAKAARGGGRRINHRRLVESYINERVGGGTLVADHGPRQALVRAIVAEARASAAPRILVSAEHFSARFDAVTARWLAEDFADLEVEILVTVRDHHARFLSSYGTFVIGGYDLNLSEFADIYLAPGARYLSVRETLEPWQEAFGPARITVVDYDAEPDVLAALLHRCGVLDPPAEATRRNAMASPVPEVVRALQIANRQIRQRQSQDPDRNHAARRQREFFADRCRTMLEAAAQNQPRRPWALTPDRLERLDAFAAEDAAWLAATYKVVMRGSEARRRIHVTDALPPATAAEELLARLLVEQATFGWWTASEALVALWTYRAGRRIGRSSAPRDG